MLGAGPYDCASLLGGPPAAGGALAVLTTGVCAPAARISRPIAAGSLAGAGGRCWRRARAACSVNLAGGVIRAGGFPREAL